MKNSNSDQSSDNTDEDTTASDWPKTKSGAIDWEFIFQEQNSGFLHFITSSQTAAGLRKILRIVMSVIFRRDEDREQLDQFNSNIDKAMPKSGAVQTFDRLKVVIATILHKLKIVRIQKAGSGGAAQNINESNDRRNAVIDVNENADDAAVKHNNAQVSHSDGPSENSEAFGQPAGAKSSMLNFGNLSRYFEWKWAALAGLFGIFLITYFVYQNMGLTRKTDDNMVRIRNVISQIKGASEGGFVGSTNSYGGKIMLTSMNGSPAIMAAKIPNIDCPSIAWSLAHYGTIIINKRSALRLTMKTLGRLCAGGSDGSTIVWIPKT
jgi:hypothetical protein